MQRFVHLVSTVVFLTELPGLAWSQVRVGPELTVNTYLTGSMPAPAVATDANGASVVVWQSDRQDGSGHGIFGQRFDASGTAEGAEFQVNTDNSSWDRNPFVASDPRGTFVVVWETLDGDAYGIRAQRLRTMSDFRGRLRIRDPDTCSASTTGAGDLSV